MSFRAPKGTDDILPPESRRWRELLRSWDLLAEQYGYAYVATPMFEATDLFARGVGEATEVVEKQMYSFKDKSGRNLTLRPEVTASVLRAYIQAGLSGEFKGAYSGPCFRYERPQEGRRRQFWQLGVEYLGAADAEADLEVIELGYRYLLDCGLGDVEVHVNSIGDTPDRVAYHALLTGWLDERSHLLSPDARRRIHTNPLRVLDSKADREVVADAPVPVDYLEGEAATHHGQLIAGLQERGIAYRHAPRLVRGLDYYNRTVFEFIPPDAGSQSTVGGGGRYDYLAELIGADHVPGVGFGSGIERVLLNMERRGTTSVSPPVTHVYVAPLAEGAVAEAMRLARQLRRAGISVESGFRAASPRSQLRRASRASVQAAVLIGARELERGIVTLKPLNGDAQIEVPQAEAVSRIRDALVDGR